ncbi:MAG: hypothetical protein AAFW60_10755, partial [Pseudomonadota bacterium]
MSTETIEQGAQPSTAPAEEITTPKSAREQTRSALENALKTVKDQDAKATNHTEEAAAKLRGRGDVKAADKAATDAMRKEL